MSHTLEKAIKRLQGMPEDRQGQFAQLLLHEIEEDQRWERSTELHADKLPGVIADVLQAGECEPLGPETL